MSLMLISKVSKATDTQIPKRKTDDQHEYETRETEASSDFHGLDMNVKTGITEKVDDLILKNTPNAIVQTWTLTITKRKEFIYSRK